MEAGIYDKWGKKIGHSYEPPKSEPPVRSSALVRRRHEHNETVLEKCVAIMREHDKRAEMANFARCGCEFCKVVRYYEPPNVKVCDPAHGDAGKPMTL